MPKQPPCGFLILDRKGEYIRDMSDQRGNLVPGLHHHPKAPERMVIVSRYDFSHLKNQGRIHDYLQPQFNIRDIDPVDLVDFLPGWTPPQAELLRDFAETEGFYDKLLKESPFGLIDKSNWFHDFQGLFEMKEGGKKLLKQFEKEALAEHRNELLDTEQEQLQEYLGGQKPLLLERIAKRIKRFCSNPFFGGSQRGSVLLQRPSCVDQVLQYLKEGCCVFIDMGGQSDDNYTIVAALFARRLLNVNSVPGAQPIRANIVMEEAHNILSAEEVEKGRNGRGSVFIELAREGRTWKLGFILVTQQPDVTSIAPQVVKTINTIVAFRMPMTDAQHIQRLKTGFIGLELEISNAPEFQGVAIAEAGPILFQSFPVTKGYMQRCADGSLAEMIRVMKTKPSPKEPKNPEGAGGEEAPPTASEQPEVPAAEDRLTQLMRQRQETIQSFALGTMAAWKRDAVEARERGMGEEE